MEGVGPAHGPVLIVTMFPTMRSPRPASPAATMVARVAAGRSPRAMFTTPCEGPQAHDKLTKILVCRNQHALILMGPSQDLLVVRRGTDIDCSDDIETHLAQPLDDGACDAFVGEQAHGHSAGNTDWWARWSAAKAWAARMSSTVKRG